MAIKLKGAVGGSGAINHQKDVALIQIMLNNLTGGKSYFKDVPLGIYGGDLAGNIKNFQVSRGLLKSKRQKLDSGIVRPGSETFKELKRLLKIDLTDLKIHIQNNVRLTFFVRKKALTVEPLVPTTKALAVPNDLGIELLPFLRRAIVEFSVLKRDLSANGSFLLTLGTKEKFYDVVSAAIVEGPSSAYLQYVLGKIPLKKWTWKINADRTVLFTSEKKPFFAGPHKLTRTDNERLKYRKIPSTYKLPIDPYEKKLLSTVVRPWRSIVEDPKTERFKVLPNTLSSLDCNFAKQAGNSLAYYGNYAKNISKAYDEIKNRQSQKYGREALLLLAAGFVFQLFVGIEIKLGLLLDPNTEKEYIYIKLGASLGAKAGAGFSAGVEILDKAIEDVGGFDYGAKFNNEMAFGPIVMRFDFGSGKTKWPPDINWKGIKGIPLEALEGDADLLGGNFKLNRKLTNVSNEDVVKQRNFLAVETDTETGEFLKPGEKSESEKRREETGAQFQKGVRKGKKKTRTRLQKAKRKLSKSEINIAEVDFGPAQISLNIKPEASGKIKMAFGPEVYAGFVMIFDVDMDLGWFEDYIYKAVRAYVPELNVGDAPLFPKNS